MRYFIVTIGALTIGLLAGRAPGQVPAMGGAGMGGGSATFGGMANPSVAGGSMNAGAMVGNLGGNANLGRVQSGVGGGYGGTAPASVVGSNLASNGGYPIAAGDARYFGQNSGTIAGIYGTGAALANQPGQPLALNRFRSTFTGAVARYNPGVQSRFGGPNNGLGYSGQNFAQGNAPGYNLPAYTYGRSFPYGYVPNGAQQISASPSPPQTNGSGFSTNVPMAGYPPWNGLPAYTYGRSFPYGYVPNGQQISASPSPPQMTNGQ